ncbi:MAG: putative rane protein [Rhodocyclales bacterium]|nr:putative rane protein [Rhodocyclales bacterium]
MHTNFFTLNFFTLFLSKFTWLDWLGLVWFMICWAGYERIVDRGWRGRITLLEETHRLRLGWARQMLVRENRIVDAALVGNLVSSVSFYANTSIYIIAGLFATLGALDRFIETAAELPFAHAISRETLELKMLMLIAVFVVAYFKFTWSLREFNVLAMIMGATPSKESDPQELELFAQRTAAVNTCAGDDFNRGIRAYYFGMAILAWMITPSLFMIATTLILVVLARREFDSDVVRALRMQGAIEP